MAPGDESYFYCCAECPRVFTDKVKLTAHKKAHYEDKLLRIVNRKRPVILLRDISVRIRKECPTCGLEILLQEFLAHLDSHSSPKEVQKQKPKKRGRPSKLDIRGGVANKELLRAKWADQWGMHKCLQCGIIFNKEINLRLHKIKKHNNKSPYSCRICGKKFLSKVRLDSHQSSHSAHSSSTASTPTMPELEYNNGIDVNNSSSSASQPPELNAEGEEESSQASNDNDTVDMEGDSYETCLTCGDAIAGPDIVVHITTHLQPGQTDCLHCEFEANQQKDLLDHMTVHYGLKSYACTFEGCGKAYHWKHSLARHHANSHSVGHPYHCSSCNESFATLREERRHALTHATNGEASARVSTDDERKKSRNKTYHCQHCDAQFPKKKLLKTHAVVHTGATDTVQKSNFIAVRRIHQPVYAKPRRKKNNESSNAVMDTEQRACKTCGEEMVLSELLIHIKTHVSKDQRQCELCQHVYANVESLREHMHTHYGLEPHKCTICHKTYSLKQSVLNHIIRNHKAIKPLEFYACTIPSTPKAIREAASIYPKKYKNGKLNSVTFTPPATPSTPQGASTPPVNTSSNFPIVQQQLLTSTPSPFASPLPARMITTSTPSDINGFHKKSLKPINFQCNFCSRVFTTKFSVQRHEAKLHNYTESDGRRVYKTTYAIAEDSSDAYGMDSQSSDVEQSWLGGDKLGVNLPDLTISYNNGSTSEFKQESLRSEIRSLLFQQERSSSGPEIVFKEIPTNLY